ncbi:Aste57867_9826 [Aphanomyces stellatus]|uniref:Methyltransferase n=1 Tax=Aphanomyces stellatus TaxID=120398 RepID=A0A485KPJ2_9STRA|nr:hypothetical protein As57867_009787 [Aphanomyces stellatus]VFT86705.1 Aste57867_9826 [Aphanomyces stellatus]
MINYSNPQLLGRTAAALGQLGVFIHAKGHLHLIHPNRDLALANWTSMPTDQPSQPPIIYTTLGVVALLLVSMTTTSKSHLRFATALISLAGTLFLAFHGATYPLLVALVTLFGTFQAAKVVATAGIRRDGSDFTSTLLGSTRILANPDSVVSPENVHGRFLAYDQLFAGARHAPGTISTRASIERRQRDYHLLVDSYYDLITDFYEYGWGQSLHFANRFRGETFHESIKRLEYFLSAKLGLNRTSLVLDLGCGIGGPMRNIARFSGASIDGITLNEYQVRVATKYNASAGLASQRCHVQQGDFMALPYAANAFDGIYAIESVCHAPDKTACFKEASRVLKPGGLFVALDWAMVNQYDATNLDHMALKEGIEVGNGLPTIDTPAQILHALEMAGLEIVEHFNIQASTLDHSKEIPWFSTLEGQWTFDGFRMTWWGRHCTYVLVTLLEWMGIAPRGTANVSRLLNQTADDLVAAGRADIFTPSYYFMARKPCEV